VGQSKESSKVKREGLKGFTEKENVVTELQSLRRFCSFNRQVKIHYLYSIPVWEARVLYQNRSFTFFVSMQLFGAPRTHNPIITYNISDTQDRSAGFKNLFCISIFH
jgi:hypothetical protein